MTSAAALGERGRKQREAQRAPRSGALRLARIGGVEIAADWSLLIIFGLVVFQLGIGTLPGWHPEWSPALVWGVALVAAVLFFASITAHELSHALVARVFGIPVRRITLYLFGGVAELEQEPRSPGVELVVAAVGPLMSIAIGVGATLLGLLLGGGAVSILADDPMNAFRAMGPVPTLLLWLGPVNMTLALFNMLPGFPLDGGRVLRAILWWTTGDLRRATRWATTGGIAVGLGLIALGVFVMFNGGFGSGIWLVLIGWFLRGAARGAYQRFVIGEVLEGVPIERVMRTSIDVVSSETTIDDLVHAHLMTTDQRAFPVVRADELVGLVCIDDIRKVAREDWARTRVEQVMTRADQLAVLDVHARVSDAIEQLLARGVDQIPVVEQGRLRGLVRWADVVKWIAWLGPTPAPARD